MKCLSQDNSLVQQGAMESPMEKQSLKSRTKHPHYFLIWSLGYGNQFKRLRWRPLESMLSWCLEMALILTVLLRVCCCLKSPTNGMAKVVHLLVSAKIQLSGVITNVLLQPPRVSASSLKHPLALHRWSGTKRGLEVIFISLFPA